MKMDEIQEQIKLLEELIQGVTIPDRLWGVLNHIRLLFIAFETELVAIQTQRIVDHRATNEIADLKHEFQLLKEEVAKMGRR
jgi:hypothetical protein